LTETIIILGAIAGGLVSGLTGFGTGLTVLAFWLMVAPPVVVAPLVVICSVVAQLQTLPSIWSSIEWKRVLPFVAGGLLGIPVGTALLVHISAADFRALIGVLLVGYCGLMLSRRSVPRIRARHAALSGIVGAVGGILGGLAGLSGVVPSVWATLQHWRKDEARSVFQTFNLTILAIAGFSQASQGLMTREVAQFAIMAIPGTIAGAWIGRRLYLRLSDDRYNRVILMLLLFAGVSLVVTSVLSG